MLRAAAILLAQDWARASRRGSRERGLSPRAARSAFMKLRMFWLLTAAFETAAEAADGTRPTVSKTAERQIPMRSGARSGACDRRRWMPPRAVVMPPLLRGPLRKGQLARELNVWIEPVILQVAGDFI